MQKNPTEKTKKNYQQQHCTFPFKFPSPAFKHGKNMFHRTRAFLQKQKSSIFYRRYTTETSSKTIIIAFYSEVSYLFSLFSFTTNQLPYAFYTRFFALLITFRSTWIKNPKTPLILTIEIGIQNYIRNISNLVQKKENLSNTIYFYQNIFEQIITTNNSTEKQNEKRVQKQYSKPKQINKYIKKSPNSRQTFSNNTYYYCYYYFFLTVDNFGKNFFKKIGKRARTEHPQKITIVFTLYRSAQLVNFPSVRPASTNNNNCGYIPIAVLSTNVPNGTSATELPKFKNHPGNAGINRSNNKKYNNWSCQF
eukprot:TRINITY_DN29570_c0_g1_i7.p1 TRINITY_DN29570_c0_g1~~TRINITY_DN29570_c0_g1_i7.p1  ORF type:complete len:307 (+),score=9.71 TRINITY_DN29570_c0_g1_i7:1076-1996(+)